MMHVLECLCWKRSGRIMLDTPRQTGLEPLLGGDRTLATTSGDEPALGGMRLIRMLRDHLLRELYNPQMPERRRMAVGDWLAEVGDPRPGTGLDARGLPDLDWVEVPAGYVQVSDYIMPFEVRRFWVARYPVTWAQYRAFLEAEDGHLCPDWWEGLRRRPEYEREVYLRDNQPAQEVSWYDAAAYCRWLSARTGIEVRLPTEWEWEMAAGGGAATRVFTWGHLWQAGYANTRESGLRRSLAVGMYPHAPAACGALDMSGNVLEWCQNEFAEPHRVDPSPRLRVYRGGSWFLVREASRIRWRSGNDPYLRYNSVGFRLACDDPWALPPIEGPEPAVEEPTETGEAAG